MPRANRHYIPGCIWHITHRCHNKEFLLKFNKDRKRYRKWLFQARKRFDFCVLNYAITRNHVHLLILDDGDRDTIPKSMQLIAGRTGQEFNERKGRHGAYWEDRYHATAIASDEHLEQCMYYIDLNMVRAGAVGHPSEWHESGYNDIQNPPIRGRIINLEKLQDLLQFASLSEMQVHIANHLQSMIQNQKLLIRDSRWSDSIAVGSKEFASQIVKKLHYGRHKPKIVKSGFTYQVREMNSSYSALFTHQNTELRLKNMYNWKL